MVGWFTLCCNFQRGGPAIFGLWQDEICSVWGKYGRGQDLLVCPILLLTLPFSGRSPDMTEILLTGLLSTNSINMWFHFPRKLTASNYFKNSIIVSNGLDPDQAQHHLVLLGLIWVQLTVCQGTSRQTVKIIPFIL